MSDSLMNLIYTSIILRSRLHSTWESRLESWSGEGWHHAGASTENDTSESFG